MRLIATIILPAIALLLLYASSPALADAGDTFYFQAKWTHIVSRQGDEIENTLNIQNRGDSTVSFVIELVDAPDWP